ncbi:putative DsbA family dithiol-disulfide isomerase [Mucilaginibacter yixingensis]|uniref:Putative DsbA family dithiol-disulfide isomerase n=1 Tax=Mucilaginibacter yixingensis TaxID=1295612 RepID=A0A2T5JEQ9_9SPHI|nr:DsbA family oxidoreductase [Mucilaginibacter yixingensis]PTR00899.1 putative DsbA family dithiol-disulfide isomerase [Mucilaginibacter yixingensis]
MIKVEIWSDVVCPFCYIGKRRFEEALNDFAGKHDVSIIWKSYLLNPYLKTDPTISINQYLADAKGWDLAYAEDLNRQVTEMAQGVDLSYRMDQIVVANSFNAHRLAHLATAKGFGEGAEEALFKAYFTEGRNIDDTETLIAIGISLGLQEADIRQMLSTDQYEAEVKMDIAEAQQLGIRGVPFFLFNEKFAVSGAQPVEVFLQALEKAAGA